MEKSIIFCSADGHGLEMVMLVPLVAHGKKEKEA